MKKLTLALYILLGSPFVYATEQATGNGAIVGTAEAGKAKATTVCVACHGADGNSINPEWPSLAGQHASYIEQQLHDFKAGVRENALMSSQAANLTEQEIADLAAYFADQTKKQGAASSAELATQGERIYRGGNQSTGLPACAGCHGPKGSGNGGAKYPALSGQHAKYVQKQLADYKSGARGSKSDQATKLMMRQIAQKLSTEEIAAVAEYISGLH
ncbi:c-type cytochrome [Beggiatoa leptomitoformis]|uniref:C-type cytochrome n=1 Tax=Beggiatoa leptomitoformis TaxID=288004 RepID=A0A2N9YEM1_9GAMM|nr:c-type cytochrome [Beggiatoa leptomitoformis]ALG68730.1 c-type cytochrome [Beggiatoa leptomitoformis]AUI68912.1 c-type cytochrome [Beggiatoa leptomitoformis]